MASLADLHRAVQKTLASGRLGQPVFLRYLVRGSEGGEAIRERMAQCIALAREWLHQSLVSVYAVGSPESCQVSLTLEFDGGATALLGYASTPPQDAGVDLLLLGNHGALYHEAAASVHAEEAQRSDADADIQAVLQRALHSGRPEPFAEESEA
jgi:hypothetical protein